QRSGFLLHITSVPTRRSSDLVLQMVPQPMGVIPLYQVLAEWNLVNSIAGLVIADTALFLPFAILLLRPFVLAIPAELYEAAQLEDRKSTRLNSSHVSISYAVF